MTNFEKVKEFMTTFGQEVKNKSEFPNEKIVELRKKLIEEEFNELKDAINDNDIVEVADALTDLLYVVYGMGAAMGIELDYCFGEVHSSNMSKLGEDGEPIYREDGKVLKGSNYKPPNLYDCVYHEEMLEKLKKIEANSYNTDREQVQQLSLFDDDSAVTGK